MLAKVGTAYGFEPYYCLTIDEKSFPMSQSDYHQTMFELGVDDKPDDCDEMRRYVQAIADRINGGEQC